MYVCVRAHGLVVLADLNSNVKVMVCGVSVFVRGGQAAGGARERRWAQLSRLNNIHLSCPNSRDLDGLQPMIADAESCIFHEVVASSISHAEKSRMNSSHHPWPRGWHGPCKGHVFIALQTMWIRIAADQIQSLDDPSYISMSSEPQ